MYNVYMKEIMRKYWRLYKGVLIGSLVLILFLGIFFRFQFYSPKPLQDFSSGTITLTEREKDGIKQNPADNSPPDNSLPNEPVKETGSSPLATPNVDNLQKEPLSGERLQQYRLLQNSLHVQQEIYMLMIQARDKETDPTVKAQVENDIAVIEKKIQEIQQALDTFHQ